MSTEELRARFTTPRVEDRPIARWWWPGCLVEEGELRREVRAIAEAGFGGVEVQLLRMNLADAPPDRVEGFLTPEWFRHVRTVAEEVAALGLRLDLTFGSGWPFGGAMVEPEHVNLELGWTIKSCFGGGHMRAKLVRPEVRPGRHSEPLVWGPPAPHRDGWAERLEARCRTVAVLAVPAESPSNRTEELGGIFAGTRLIVDASSTVRGDVVDITDKVNAKGFLVWDDAPEGSWQILWLRQVPADMEVSGYAGPGPRLVVDHFSREAMDAYIAAVGGAFDEHLSDLYGTGVHGVFSDSLEIEATPHWTEDLLERFREDHGYDLLPVLPFCLNPGERRFGGYPSLPLFEGAPAAQARVDLARTLSRTMIEGFFAPLCVWAAERGLTSRVEAHGAPADIVEAYGLADVPETENLYSGGRFELYKLASSASYGYGKPVTSAEAFAFAGGEYRTTPQQIRALANRLVGAGVNQLVVHGVPYRLDDRPFPGWHPFADGFGFSMHLNETDPFWADLPAINGHLARLCALTREAPPVLDVALYWERLGYPDGGERLERSEAERALRTSGYGYGRINPDLTARSRAADGLLTTPGGGTYRAIVVEGDRLLTDEVAAALAAHEAAGVPLLRLEDGTTVLDALAAAGVDPPFRWLDRPARTYASHHRCGEADVYLVWNEAEEGVTATLDLPHPSSTLERWDASTGEMAPLGSTTIELGSSDLAVIVADPAVDHPAAEPERLAEIATLDVDGLGLDPTLSGDRVYTARVMAAEAGRYVLDLGQVHDVARVGGTTMLWPPYRCDVELAAGDNEIEITVTATLANRLLAEGKTMGVILGYPMVPPDPQPVGLVGPVTLLR